VLHEAGLVGARAPAGLVAVAVALLAGSSQARADEPVEPSLGARARVRVVHPAGVVTGTEFEQRRSALGDSFNPAEALPGAVPVFSGVPYLMVRGAPPAGMTSYLDGVAVPSLFHLALGPSITHPAMVGQLRFHPGVAPARFGRHTGATLSAEEAPVSRRDRQTRAAAKGEAEARLLDVQGFASSHSDPSFALHARLGYPGAMLDLVGSSAVLSYWDYHARLRTQLSTTDDVSVSAFGARDRVGDREQPDDDIDLQFHRGVVRLTRSLQDVELGASIQAGYERGVLGRELSAVSSRVGPAFFIQHRDGAGMRVRFGADMEAKVARVRRFVTPLGSLPMPDPDQVLGMMGVTTVPDFESGATEFIDRAPLARIAERNAMGAYLEFGLALPSQVEVEAGARTDLWLTAGRSQHAVDPRVLVRWRALPRLRLHAAVGSAHQAAASPLPIPGLSDFELDHGLQSALQSEAGAELELPAELTASATGFFHEFSHLVFLELIINCEGNSDPFARLQPFARASREVALCRQQGLPRGSGSAYGAEFMLRRSLRHRLSGWASYTLAWAQARAADGNDFIPQFDVRHLLNVVMTYRWGDGFDGGVRLHYRSGKPAVNTIFDFAQGRLERLHARLPPFLRVDLNAGYRWATSWGALWITLQWLNVGFARETTKRDCRFDSSLNLRCEVDYQPAIVLPNAGIRAEF
jgi:hypothetical protein